MDISTITFKGQPAFRMKSDSLEVILTAYGAKIQSILYHNREFLHQNTDSNIYHVSDYGSSFTKGEFSGFDEMFPNISAGSYPDEPWKGTLLPDHGEVWSREWECSKDASGLTFKIKGIILPYCLTKHVSLEGNKLCLSYLAENLSDSQIKCIWAAHPLFVLEDGMKLDLACCTEIVNVYGGRRFLGNDGQHWEWPAVDNGRDLQYLDSSYKTSNKYYVANTLSQNMAHLRYPSGTVVTFNAPADQVPYLGVWIDEDGEDMRCVALEPCTGAFDSIERADRENAVCLLDAKGKKEWSLDISFNG